MGWLKLMQKIKSFFKLSSDQRSLLLMSLFLTVFVCLTLYFLSFSRIQSVLNKFSKINVRKTSKTVKDIVWSVRVASYYVPNSTCLTHAIVAQALLKKYKHNSKLKIGVNNSDNFEAHAWLELNNKIIFGESETDFFTILELDE